VAAARTNLGVAYYQPEVYYGLGVLYGWRKKGNAINPFEEFLAIGPGQDLEAVDPARQELEALEGK
jgi:hypothetical protein